MNTTLGIIILLGVNVCELVTVRVKITRKSFETSKLQLLRTWMKFKYGRSSSFCTKCKRLDQGWTLFGCNTQISLLVLIFKHNILFLSKIVNFNQRIYFIKKYYKLMIKVDWYLT